LPLLALAKRAWLGDGEKNWWNAKTRLSFKIKYGGIAQPTATAGWCGHEICLSILPERVLRGQTTSNFCHYNVYWTCGPSCRSWNFYLMDNVAGTYFRNFVWVNFLKEGVL